MHTSGGCCISNAGILLQVEKYFESLAENEAHASRLMVSWPCRYCSLATYCLRVRGTSLQRLAWWLMRIIPCAYECVDDAEYTKIMRVSMGR
jgi:hypothetical protein